jgi:hypothetical protein
MQQFFILHNLEDEDIEITRLLFAHKIKKMRENYPKLLTLAERESEQEKQRAIYLAEIGTYKPRPINPSEHINYNE